MWAGACMCALWVFHRHAEEEKIEAHEAAVGDKQNAKRGNSESKNKTLSA